MCTNLNGARKVLPGHPIKDCFVLKDKIQKKKRKAHKMFTRECANAYMLVERFREPKKQDYASWPLTTAGYNDDGSLQAKPILLLGQHEEEGWQEKYLNLLQELEKGQGMQARNPIQESHQSHIG